MKKIIGFIRDGRIASLEYYKFFKDFQVEYIVGSHQPIDTMLYSHYPAINIRNLSLYKPLLVNPAGHGIENYGNLSWFFFKDLNRYISTCDYIGLSDMYYFWNYQALNIAREKRVPVFTEIWCNIAHHPSQYIPPYSFITQQMVSKVELFLLRNKLAYSYTDSLNIPRSRTRLLYKGVDTVKFSPQSKAPAETITILYIGILNKAKGVDLLLTAYKKLKPKHPNIKLRIVGRGPLQNEIETCTPSLEIEYLGTVPYQLLPQIYNTATIFCSPSQKTYLAKRLLWQEYFSYTLMEAQASALPIVSTATGGVPEEIDSRNLLIKENSLEELILALEEMITNNTLRKELSIINRNRALQLFDAQTQSQKEEALIHSFFGK